MTVWHMVRGRFDTKMILGDTGSMYDGACR